MAARKRRGIWLVAGVAAASAACDGILGIREYAAIDAGTPDAAAPSTAACGISPGTVTCGACIQSNCCSQAGACAASSGCTAYESCLLPCGGDYACRSRCAIAHFA